MKKENTPQNKYLFMEALRIVAIFFVLFNHTNDYGFTLYAHEPVGSATFWIYLIPSIICKISVPLFFMISGALLLRKDEPIGYIWKNRILRIVLILMGFSLVYYLFGVFTTEGMEFSVLDYLKRVYSNPTAPHLWYLYRFIAYLAVLPILRMIAKQMDKKGLYYMVAIVVFFSGIVPSLDYLFFKGEFSMISHLKISWLANQTLFYPIVGYLINTLFDADDLKKFLPFVWIANIAGIAFSCVMTYIAAINKGIESVAGSAEYHNSFVMLNCIALFVTFKYIFEMWNCPAWLEKFIVSGGQCTFGIFLIHMLIHDAGFYNSWLDGLRSTGMNPMVIAFIMTLILMIMCHVIIWLVSKVPYLRKAVGMK